MPSLLSHELIRKRFMDKVSPPDADGCWMWKAANNAQRYGRFGIERKVWNAHQAAWMIFRGPIPKGKWVLHTCDKRGCVYPSHLYIGTIKENTADAIARDRYVHRHGEASYTAILKWPQVRAIRERYKNGDQTYSRLAKQYGVSKSCIENIVSGKKWKENANVL